MTLGSLVEDVRATRKTSAPQLRADPGTSGLRAGAVVLVGVAAMNAGNYLFHVLAARELGPARYGDLATFVILAGLISLPLSGVQIWVARHVAEYESTNDPAAAHWFVRRVGLMLAAIGTIVTIFLLALVYPIQHALAIASPAAVALAALTAFPAIVSPVTWGLAQGLQRFTLVARHLRLWPGRANRPDDRRVLHRSSRREARCSRRSAR